ncbi:tagaturonate reductase [Sediminibacillus albus]|uniref:Tagaturonate reductase n=1 Tax=Sediminibacillus albus TaxID=407036 RepID=A0A1G8WHU5_9BACI|nr:tagaturonate reductase [Sediminibacillus albus]SDJ77663.1 tagaturonate reductase [Sediminibacillus albus]
MPKLSKRLQTVSQEVEWHPIEGSMPEKVLQIGEGNFLRGFVDWMVHQMNKQGIFNGSIVAVQPTPHGRVLPKLVEQDCLYTTVLRGRQDGRVVDKAEIIPSISRGINPYEEWEKVLQTAASSDLEIIISNTTEAGITYMEEPFPEKDSPLSFPGKLAAILYHRYQAFSGKSEAGLFILPCELIEGNGGKLKALVKQIARDWQLGSDFIEWVETANYFYDTLVDRIVTGYPNGAGDAFMARLGYHDRLMTIGEPYHLFVIDGNKAIREKFPLDQAGINVKWGDIERYRQLKVRLLNGPHTLMSSVAFLAGADTVLDVMEDNALRGFIDKGFEEILLTVPMDNRVKQEFAEAVKERFLNPYNKHYLLDIAMNSIYKYKTRLLPALHTYTGKSEKLPEAIVLSLAALLVFYRPIRHGEKGIIGMRNGEEYAARESEITVKKISECWEKYSTGEIGIPELVFSFLGSRSIWEADLNEIEQLTQTVSTYVEQILLNGMEETLRKLLKDNVSPLL